MDEDKNGKVSQEEIDRANKIMEMELSEQKAQTQKRMAWSALLSMIGVIIILMSPLVSDSRVSALADLLGLFFIAQAGIVGAYMGVQAWLTKTSSSSTTKSNYLKYEE